MEKMRVESLEYLCDICDPEEIAQFAFKLVDEQVIQLRKIGIETDFPKIIILKNVEYKRNEKKNLNPTS
jgi:hypothetical protein